MFLGQPKYLFTHIFSQCVFMFLLLMKVTSEVGFVFLSTVIQYSSKFEISKIFMFLKKASCAHQG